MPKWRKETQDATYEVDEIEQRLKDELPNWYYEDGLDPAQVQDQWAGKVR